MRVSIGKYIAVVVAAAATACSNSDSPPAVTASGEGGNAGSPPYAGAAGTGGAANLGGGGATGTGGSGGSVANGSGGSWVDASTVTDASTSTEAGAQSDAGARVSSVGAWTVYADPYANEMPNPTVGIQGTAFATKSAANGMHLEFSITGLPPNRIFGSHLHILACDDNKAGGHYENMPAPAEAGANDPAYANGMNEAWLDASTDANGAAHSMTDVPWFPRAGGAKSIIIHDHGTAPGGVAGAKLACLSIPF